MWVAYKGNVKTTGRKCALRDNKPMRRNLNEDSPGQLVFKTR